MESCYKLCLQRIVEQRQPDNVDPAKAEKMKKSREDIVPLVAVTVVCNCLPGSHCRDWLSAALTLTDILSLV